MRSFWDIQGEMKQLTVLVWAGDRQLEAKSMEVASGYGLDHQGTGYRVRGDTGQRQSSQERRFVRRVHNRRDAFFLHELSC